MSKVGDITVAESSGTAKESSELKANQKGMNGSLQGTTGPIYNPPATAIPRLIVDVEQAMEVDDDEDQEMPDEVPELQYFRSYGDRQIRPGTASIKSSKAFDTVTISSTRSLYDADLEYHVENNRRYVPNYFMPNDEDEQLRLQIVHQVYLSMLNSKLTTVPLVNPAKILDVGTGTGEWAIGMGEAYPKADVTGVDLSAIQPTAVPPNVFFEIFDAEDDDDWTYPENFFDLIHFRGMTMSFRSWDLMYERAYRHLKPGGWIEVVDFDDQENSLLSHFGKDSEVRSWFSAVSDATSQIGKEIGVMHLQADKFASLGFHDVKVTHINVPMGAWPTDPAIRSTAKLWLVACLAGFEAYGLRPLTQVLGWSAEEVRRLCKKVEMEIKGFALDKDKSHGISIAITVVIGRKPLSPSEQDTAGPDSGYVLEADADLPEFKRVKTRASSQDEVETPLQEDTSDAGAEADLMQELRKQLRRARDRGPDDAPGNSVDMAHHSDVGNLR